MPASALVGPVLLASVKMPTVIPEENVTVTANRQWSTPHIRQTYPTTSTPEPAQRCRALNI